MTYLEAKKRKLAEDIDAAFSDVPRPRQITSEKDYLDLEADAIRDFLIDKKWKDLNAEFLQSNYEGDSSAILIFLTPQAFHYFLPAFLYMCLYEYVSSDMTGRSVWNALGQSPLWNLDSKNKEGRLSLLTSSQKNVVARTIFLVLEEHGDIAEDVISQELRERWRPYL